MFKAVREQDPDIFGFLKQEFDRQEYGLELIASENFVSPAVLEVMGTPLTNKYAEGYPRNRYYGGCQYYDEIEILAIQRAHKLFGVEHDTACEGSASVRLPIRVPPRVIDARASACV